MVGSCHRRILLACAALLALPATALTQGLMISSFGPVHAGMGGASTAAPVEALSSLAWNPASISGMPSSELSVGMGLLLSDPVLDSSIPGVGSGSTGAEPGVLPVPNLGWVHKMSDAATWGLGIMSVAGFKVNYPASLSNPVLAPQSNTADVPGGLGSLYSEGTFLQFAPVFSYAITERLAVGAGPTVTMGEVAIDPLTPAAPNDADSSSVFTYPAGRGTRYAWGGGAQLGVYYITDRHWHLGASLKSPQWMEDFRVHTEDEVGRPATETFKIDLPLIFSVGGAYSGIEGLVFALDLRYFDYRNTDGFRATGYGPPGNLQGLSWTNQFALATGIQYRLFERLLLRTGYTFNTSPYASEDTFFNVSSPLNYQHQLGLGGSWKLSPRVAFHLSYTHYFQFTSTGPIILPSGELPGSSVTNTVSAYFANLGVTVQY